MPKKGWASIKNGALLRSAETILDVFVTVDKNLPFQQNLAALNLGVIILDTPDNKVGTLGPLMGAVLSAGLRGCVWKCGCVDVWADLPGGRFLSTGAADDRYADLVLV